MPLAFQRVEERGVDELSILYLRCRAAYYVLLRKGKVNTFNSLFEMPEAGVAPPQKGPKTFQFSI